jgi:hypothetical protein
MGSEACNDREVDRISRRTKGVRLYGRLSKDDSKEWLLSHRPPAIMQLLSQKSVVRYNLIVVRNEKRGGQCSTCRRPLKIIRSRFQPRLVSNLSSQANHPQHRSIKLQISGSLEEESAPVQDSENG